jgi:hypothetical protein
VWPVRGFRCLYSLPFGFSGACECPAPAAPKKEQQSYRQYEENGQRKAQRQGVGTHVDSRKGCHGRHG